VDAHIAAGDPAESAPWIARRARYLLDHCLGPYTAVLSRLRVRASTWFFIGLAMAGGLASNYLGPSTKIHVIWNPMVILIGWNLLFYGVLAIRSAFAHPAETPDAGSSAVRPQHHASNVPGYRPGVVERIILGPALSWLLSVKAGVDEMRQGAVGRREVAQRFAELWWPVMRPIVRLWLRRTLHLSAIGIAIGAIVGMYVRGLFFDYNVVWQSTFVKDPETVVIILRYLLGPAAIVIGQPLPTGESVAALFGPDGDYAASWIHLYAVSALLFIVIPRGFLALAVTSQLGRQRRNVQLDLRADYYADVLEKAHNVRPKELEARVRGEIRNECLKVSDDFAKFVCSELYDDRIAPRLRKFRETGGTLRQLEDDLRRECQSFGPELQAQIAKTGHELERRVSDRVKELLGESERIDTQPANGLFGQLSAASFAVTHAGDRVSGDLTSLVTSVVSGSVGIAIGTISGGFGEALGVALLVGVVESGPVGWVIGAIGGLVATFGVLTLGRERLRQGAKDVPLPAAALKLGLWNSRYERLIADGRRKCDESVRNSLAPRMDQFSSAIGDQIWHRLRAIIGESQRPARGARTLDNPPQNIESSTRK
ncbi:MAG TPA: DUF2868 domain-containing protein, partial [Candidatus Binatia bacterium]|nr:DUF2868 domain-containing protein [Candidatus Binatia bacterium]